MKSYLDLCETVLIKGRKRITGTQGIANTVYAGAELRFRPSEAFPLMTTKDLGGKVWRALVHELLWFLSGSSKISDLNKHGVRLWDQWASEEISLKYNLPAGDLGRIYGPQWRSWLKRDGQTIDQITKVINEIKTDPNSKRMMVTSWNPEDVDGVMVAPCHGIFKFVVAEGVLDLCMFQRSADLPVGIPFNIASYSLLLLMVAQVTDLQPGEFSHYLADIHVYDDQVDGIKQVMARTPKKLPKIKLNPDVKNLFDFKFEDFELVEYYPHPYVKIPVAL
jgi:thymidylate synthase